MTWLQRVRPLLYLLGVLLVVGSLLGARLLTHGSGGGAEPTPKSAAPQGNGKAAVPMTIVTGFGDSDPRPIEYGLPPVLQSGRISKLSVSQGQEVKKGDVLYKFDTTVQEAERDKAKTAVDSAKVAVELAESQRKQYPTKLDIQRQMVETAKVKTESTEGLYRAVEGTLLDRLNQEYPDNPAQRNRLYEINVPRIEQDIARKTAAREYETAKANLEAAVVAQKDLDLQVKKAEAAVRQAESLERQAQSVIDQCTVKASADGTIERVSATEGATLGLGTHTPALVLIPSGSRVVRAEVEAEFANRIGEDKKGKEVTITDHFNDKIVYKGVVKQIGTAFLQKRNAADGFGANDTRVLEVVVEVTDAAPAGKPPLKVGQKVRVNFGP